MMAQIMNTVAFVSRNCSAYSSSIQKNAIQPIIVLTQRLLHYICYYLHGTVSSSGSVNKQTLHPQCQHNPTKHPALALYGNPVFSSHTLYIYPGGSSWSIDFIHRFFLNAASLLSVTTSTNLVYCTHCRFCQHMQSPPHLCTVAVCTMHQFITPVLFTVRGVLLPFKS